MNLRNIISSLTTCLMMFLIFSCASYHQQSLGFYDHLASGNYEKASKNLDHNKLLRKHRNHLLYLMEKGRVEHLLQHYEKSNAYLNEADLLMESSRRSVMDIAMGNLMNPMMETYRGEDFEKYMVHYYKALNYLFLNKTDDALVEARRISLRTYIQEDEVIGKRYSEDAFSLMLQGMIYEKGGDINNAFIAYRNAADLYLKNDQVYYGTKMPEQLKKDVLRTAFLNGFHDELERYEEIFQNRFNKDEIKQGEVILFWENGLAPVKKELNLFFSLTKDGSGEFFFTDAAGDYHIPFDHSTGYNRNEITLNANSFRATVPQYIQQPLWFKEASVSINDESVVLEPAQNINDLAFATLQERRIKDLSRTLTRLAIKKIAEEAAKPKEDEKDNKKKNGMEALSIGIKLFSFASEKADTRNWQSLPHTIYFTRVPLKKGSNTISIDLQGHSGKTRNVQFTVENNGGLYFQNICTLQ